MTVRPETFSGLCQNCFWDKLSQNIFVLKENILQMNSVTGRGLDLWGWKLMWKKSTASLHLCILMWYSLPWGKEELLQLPYPWASFQLREVSQSHSLLHLHFISCHLLTQPYWFEISAHLLVEGIQSGWNNWWKNNKHFQLQLFSFWMSCCLETSCLELSRGGANVIERW